MQTYNFLAFNKSLRECCSILNDEEFKIVMAGLKNNELKILKLIYGNDYSTVNQVKLSEHDANILIKLLQEKIPKRIKLVIDGRKGLPVNKENNFDLSENQDKTIFDYFKGYDKRRVLRAILRLEPDDYCLLKSLCNNNFANPLNLKLYRIFHKDLGAKIKRRIISPQNFPVKNAGIGESAVLNEDIMNRILMFLNTSFYQEMLETFSQEEALFYAIKNGFVDNVSFDLEMMSAILNCNEIEIDAIQKNILSKLALKKKTRVLKQ